MKIAPCSRRFRAATVPPPGLLHHQHPSSTNPRRPAPAWHLLKKEAATEGRPQGGLQAKPMLEILSVLTVVVVRWEGVGEVGVVCVQHRARWRRDGERRHRHTHVVLCCLGVVLGWGWGREGDGEGEEKVDTGVRLCVRMRMRRNEGKEGGRKRRCDEGNPECLYVLCQWRGGEIGGCGCGCECGSAAVFSPLCARARSLALSAQLRMPLNWGRCGGVERGPIAAKRGKEG